MQERTRRHHAWLIAAALVVCVGLLCVSKASQDVPTAYDLHQNDPNPFCADSLGEWTEIRFEVPALAYVRVVVADATDLIVMRTLMIGEVDAGYYVLSWDGRDDWGGYMRSDEYPYSLQERDPETGRWSIVRRRVLIIDCTTRAESVSWARIKALYLQKETPTAN